MKTSELTGRALDWAVATCEGVALESFLMAADMHADDGLGYGYQYSTQWGVAGPIIEREGISIAYLYGSTWGATTHPIHKVFQDSTDHFFQGVGQTVLIAAMRCYVASKLGGEIDIPEELK